MATGNGYGRGGRGAALLQLLNNPVRQPGAQINEQGDSSQANAARLPGLLHQSQQVDPPQQPLSSLPKQPLSSLQVTTPRLPVGRGADLLQKLQQRQQLGVTSLPESAESFVPGTSQLKTQQALGVTTQQPTASVFVPTGGNLSAAVECSAPKGIGRAAKLSQLSASQPKMDFASPLTPPVSRPVEELNTALSRLSVGGISREQVVEEATGSVPANVEPSRLQRILDRLDKDRPPVVRMGSAGEKIPVSANYIALRCVNAGVFQYSVSFHPVVDSISMRQKMMREHTNVIGETKAFDGAILFLPIQLHEQETCLKSIRPSDGQEITIRINLVKVLPPAACLQLYNVVFRRIMSILKMCQVGRNYFLPSGSVPVPQHKLEVWPGYITAIAEYEGGVMLLTDVSHRVLRTATVLDVIGDVIQKNPRGFQDEVNQKLIGCMVLTRYNNKTYRIDDIAWDKNPMSTFQTMSGENITFVDYYKTAYNKVIQDHQQPLLIHIPKKRELGNAGKGKKKLEVICLIPELSFMTGLTDEIRKDYLVMKDLATHTRLTPAQRRISLRNFCRNVNSIPEAKAELSKWGLELDTDIMELSGRLLSQEKIVLKNRQLDAGADSDWSRAITRESVLTPVDLSNWMIVTVSRDSGRAMNFVRMYMQCARDMGIRVEKPDVCELQNDRTETYLKEIRARMTDRTQVVVVIFPTSRDDRYNAIKKLCCVEQPVPSQVINAKTISSENKLRSVTQKIALQINCKLGGELWAVKIPTKGLMVCGIDTYHDPGQRKNSVAGFVSSVNVTCTRWYSRICCQMPGEELVNGLKVCFTASLRKYHEINHKLPDRIIIYRDGVGDGQLSTVANYEVVQLMDCFKHFGEQYQPNLAVIVVQKRINTRILARKGTGPTAVLENPPPGTILDHTITRKDWFDFFLVSQHVRQGTVSPTHYIVVHDTSNWDVDKLQCLSYKMTHLYYNWPGTVRVPAPCQYAHKLAYLVGQNIRKEPSQRLSDRLFFL